MSASIAVVMTVEETFGMDIALTAGKAGSVIFMKEIVEGEEFG